MLDEDKKREIQKAAAGMEFIPAEITMTEKKSHYKKIPLTEISGLGAEFAEMMPAFRTITSTTTANVSGLYRCTIPKGVSGTLAKAKDGSGYLGTIMNNGIKGQARWNPVDKVSATKSIVAPIDPVSIFMVAVTVEMSQKLDKIEKLGNEIFDYLKAQDRAKLESNYEALINVYSNFKNNLNDEKWQILKYNDVQTIKRETSAQVKVLRSQIEKTIDRHDLVHNELQASDLVNKVQNQFYYYRLGVFMYAFASFIEALLQGNFEEGNLKAIQKDISKYNQNYEKFYKDCYKKLERYSNTTVASQTLKAISNASGQMSMFTRNIPVIKEAPLAKAFKAIDKNVKRIDKNHIKKNLKKFSKANNSGAKKFEDELKVIGRLYNEPMDILIDQKNLYIKNK